MDLSVLTQKEFDQMGRDTIESMDEHMPYFMYLKKRAGQKPNPNKLKNETNSPIN